MEKQRLQKIIAESGLCSRRKAEELIKSGVVLVNGRPCKLGDSASPRDTITIKGEVLRVPKKRVKHYIMLNKPRGYVTTVSDELGRKNVTDLLTGVAGRVYPVGRLDKDSEGLLLFTNDGDLANAVMHPRGHIPKNYRVTIRGKVSEEQLAVLSLPMDLDGDITGEAHVEVLTAEPGRTVLMIVIKEGKNRQIRRMCEKAGLEVARLKRVAVGPIKLGMLKPGAWRDLTDSEIKALRGALKI
ncbi:MAG: rRNA pseudouridine synthase [Ruminococcus sp.]|jgi:23S rRNA pseudouridine2605 synthase|nr:rRNA pseudouridine synthase [Ruminococcus sp.]